MLFFCYPLKWFCDLLIAKWSTETFSFSSIYCLRYHPFPHMKNPGTFVFLNLYLLSSSTSLTYIHTPFRLWNLIIFSDLLGRQIMSPFNCVSPVQYPTHTSHLGCIFSMSYITCSSPLNSTITASLDWHFASDLGLLY